MSETKTKILMVDDRPENLFALEKIIQAEDRELFKAESGAKALKLNLEHEFALILSDVQMPEMDGFEMLELLRMDDKARLIPVIFLTALSKEEKYVHKGYSEGAVDYLFKPLDVQVVKAKVDVFVSMHKYQVKLAEQAEQLLELNNEKNKFLGMAAHDLRNPIGIIEHYSKFLIEDLSSSISKKDLASLEIIKTTSHLMHNLVTELLDVSKIESGVFDVNTEPVQLNEIIRNSVAMNSIYGERKNIELELNLGDAIPTALLDPGKIVQVLNNLISNAIKYSPESTKVVVSSRLENGNMVISVKDEGLGISEEYIPTLFGAYTTTSNKATAGEKSTGLGLMIVAKIVEAHSGEISVKSEKGVGSEFIVKIPVKEGEKTKSQDGFDISPEILANPGLKILVVDDNILIREISREIFRPFDVNFITAEDGEDALATIALAESEGQPFDLIFTDLNMPKKGGEELTVELRQKHSLETLPIVGLSATLSSSIEESCKKSGMNYIGEKPVSRPFINSVLTEYLSVNKKIIQLSKTDTRSTG